MLKMTSLVPSLQQAIFFIVAMLPSSMVWSKIMISFCIGAGALVYGIAAMIGALLSGFLRTKFKMKNVLRTLYAMRVVISSGFLLLPKTIAFAFTAASLSGLCGDATVPPASVHSCHGKL